jgi:hypothetical protein
MAKIIKLTQGKCAIVDDWDFIFLSKYKWYFAEGYAMSGGIGEKNIRMHRLIMQPQGNNFIDHKNRNGLDNRRSNLRICTMGENKRNQKIYKNNTSGFKGVCLRNKLLYKIKKWQARISVGGKRISLGYHKTRKEAAIAYNMAAQNLHGEYAKLNTI